jgi:hypothetical protein
MRVRHWVLKDLPIYVTLPIVTMTPKFTTAQVNQIIDEYVRAKNDVLALETAIPETALYLEESFGIRLSDAEMTREHLASPEAIMALVTAKLSAGGEAR